MVDANSKTDRQRDRGQDDDDDDDDNIVLSVCLNIADHRRSAYIPEIAYFSGRESADQPQISSGHRNSPSCGASQLICGH